MQGDMFVPEYAERFKHLDRFHTLKMAEDWQCRKFENGLRGWSQAHGDPTLYQGIPCLGKEGKGNGEVKSWSRDSAAITAESGRTI